MNKLNSSLLALLVCLACHSSKAGTYDVSYTVTGSSSTGATPTAGDPNFEVWVFSQPSGGLSGSMTVQATFVWQPSFPGELPPAQIQVQEYATAGINVSGTNLGGAIMNNPFNDPITVQRNTSTSIYEYRQTNPGTSGHFYILNNPPTTFTAPVRSISAQVGGLNYTGDVFLYYEATTWQ